MYLINAVDEVTQFQAVCAVERLSEAYLLPVMAAMMDAFPFAIRGFHSDNGSEYINHKVAALLEKRRIEQTQLKKISRVSGKTGMFFKPPRRARAGRFAGGWRVNAVRRQTGQGLPKESPSSHLRAS